MRDPYSILGVAKDVSADEIKRAFRKRAKALHPDTNKSDPKAAEKFAELNGAYDILSDAGKRKQFDRGEIDGEGKPRFTGFGSGSAGGSPFGAGAGGGFAGGFSGGDSFFEQFVRGTDGSRASSGRGTPPPDFGDFFDVLSGMTSGRAGRAQPGGANGFGEEFSTRRRSADLDVTLSVSVPFLGAARGTSQRVVLPSGDSLDVAIPAGTRDGHKLRLKGKGRRTPQGQAGDAYIIIKVEPHAAFRVDGKDVRLDLPVALDEAVLGGNVRVPTLDGAVDLRIPAMASSGKQFRLKGKGLPAADGAGDLYVTLRIVLPEGEDAALSALATQLKARRTSDPRKDIL